MPPCTTGTTFCQLESKSTGERQLRTPDAQSASELCIERHCAGLGDLSGVALRVHRGRTKGYVTRIDRRGTDGQDMVEVMVCYSQAEVRSSGRNRSLKPTPRMN